MNSPLPSRRFDLRSLCAAVAALALFAPAPAPGQPANAKALFDEGVRLFEGQRFAEALVKFEQIQRGAPNYAYARIYKARVRIALAQGAEPGNRLESQLSKLILPQIHFREVPLGDILDHLAVRAEELSGGELTPNFIFKGTTEQRQNTLVTLSLRNVTITEAIRYVGQLSRTRFTYEPDAVVGKPMGGSANQPGDVP